MRTAVITIAAGRPGHLRKQLQGLAGGTQIPGQHIVVAMGDPAVPDELRGHPARAVYLAAAAPLPVAAARNLGARTAITCGAELMIFLDVDVIPGPQLIQRYHRAALNAVAPTLLCGPVTYLPPPPATGYDLAALPTQRAPHPARPDPPGKQVLAGDDFSLFWSLSFAVTTDVWRTLGGFCPRYRGYGGEDTDFAYKAAALGVRLSWVGGADAYHQYHPVTAPPFAHCTDILRNATTFHQRWGWWPMSGWLNEFADAGLLAYDATADSWTAVRADSFAARAGTPPLLDAAPLLAGAHPRQKSTRSADDTS